MKLIIFLAVFIFSLIFPSSALAKENLACKDRYVTLVNPVRGRDKWGDKSLGPLHSQYEVVRKHNFPATWLLQYDALSDSELTSFIKSFESSQEAGLFLEVSPLLTKKARVIYPHAVAWTSPNAIFLSGYSQSERRKLINTLFKTFKETFGYFPKSVGAWWIDSYSLDYMEEKYDISGALIVADQKTTDNYGVWGQWWGVPYHPSKANILTPAKEQKSKQDVVVIQWAQRHPDLAYGEGPKFSNYSLQANDYLRSGETLEFFRNLSQIYLNCTNPIGQITVGLETGMESIEFNTEYQRQIDFLNNLEGVKILTMSQFSQVYRDLFPENPERVVISGKKTSWVLNREERINQKLEERLIYDQDVAFFDYFVKDFSGFLERRLPVQQPKSSKNSQFPAYLPLWGIVSLYFIYIRKIANWFGAVLFLLACFGLIFKSEVRFGWQVFYGPEVGGLVYLQSALVLMVFAIFYFLKSKIFALTIPLTFGLDFLIRILRYSYFSGSYYFGILVDALRFIGFKFTRPFSISLVSNDFPSVTASSLLKFDFARIWESPILSLLVYPLVHILAAFIIFKLLRKLSLRWQKIFLGFFVFLFGLHLLSVINSDPRVVIPTK